MTYVNNKYKRRLNSAKKQLVKRFGRGTPKNWRNKDFDELSFSINQSTKVLISPATLKRIFGKNKTPDGYYPQEATIDAMENYALLDKKSHVNKPKFRITKIIIFSLPPILASILYFLIFPVSLKDDTDLKATLKLTKIDGANPATVYFEYQIPQLKDSVFISYGDDSEDAPLFPETNQSSHYYRFPGLFNARIQSKKGVLSDTVSFLIPTKNWQALTYYYNQEPGERYYPLPLDLSVKNGVFHPTGKTLNSIGIDTTQIVVVRLDNFRQSATNGDSFELNTLIKSTNYWPAIRCYSAYIWVYGENGNIMFRFTNEGCSQFGEFQLSENSVTGTSYDLTGFSIDMKSWNKIHISNQEKSTQVKVNDELIFSDNYNNSIGNIVGVSLQFHGSGYVDYFELLDIDGNPVFANDF